MLHCGLPVVASNLGGLKEIFIDNENALLVNTIDKTNIHGVSIPREEELINHIYELLSNKALRLGFSRKAVIRANKLFTSKVMVDQYLQIIKSIFKNLVPKIIYD